MYIKYSNIKLFLFPTSCSLLLSHNNTLWNASKPCGMALKQFFFFLAGSSPGPGIEPVSQQCWLLNLLHHIGTSDENVFVTVKNAALGDNTHILKCPFKEPKQVHLRAGHRGHRSWEWGWDHSSLTCCRINSPMIPSKTMKPFKFAKQIKRLKQKLGARRKKRNILFAWVTDSEQPGVYRPPKPPLLCSR